MVNYNYSSEKIKRKIKVLDIGGLTNYKFYCCFETKHILRNKETSDDENPHTFVRHLVNLMIFGRLKDK